MFDEIGWEGGGGGATFIREGVQYREERVSSEDESVLVKVWGDMGRFSLLNYYNPCTRMSVDAVEKVFEGDQDLGEMSDLDAHVNILIYTVVCIHIFLMLLWS